MKFAEPDSGYERLESQIRWYDQKSGAAQRNFKWGRYFVIAAAALIPIAALMEFNIAAALLGGLIAISEAIQHVNQWHHNWITYRSTCEALRHERYTYIEGADPYDLEDERRTENFWLRELKALSQRNTRSG